MDKYTSLFEINTYIYNGKERGIMLSNDDIISLSIIHDYDHAFFPIIRLRLYIDLPKFAYINEDPNNILVSMVLNGDVYGINEESSEKSYTKRGLSWFVNFGDSSPMYGYIETKNNPYSKFDNYQMGEKRNDDLNTNNKVPLTIYCYDKDLIRKTKQQVKSIYKNTDLFSVVQDMYATCEIQYDPMYIGRFDNNKMYEQILIPNLSFIDAISYLDTYYGLYKSGALLYSHHSGQLGLSSSKMYEARGYYDCVRVSSYKSGNTFSGLDLTTSMNSKQITLVTPEQSVVIKSQTDLMQATNAQIFGSLNVDDFKTVSAYLDETFTTDMPLINTPPVMHKTKNEFIPSTYKARVDERNTRIDLSLNGYPYGGTTCNCFQFVFDNPIRGNNIDKIYRPMYATHTFTNIGSGLFDIQSTFQLC